MTVRKSYRNAFIVQNTGHDFTDLLKVTERIVYVLHGNEAEEDRWLMAKQVLSNFDPQLDIIVPVGNTPANILVGTIVGIACLNQHWDNYTMAIYKDRTYHFVVVPFISELFEKEQPDVR